MNNDYTEIKVESFIPDNTSGLHGKVHIRPLEEQSPFMPDMFVECSKELSEQYEVGTKFLIRAKIISRNGGKEFVYSSYRWPYQVINKQQTI